MMEAELVRNGVDVSGSGRAAMPSGQGLVLLQPGGAATSIVLWGANTAFTKVGWGRGVQLLLGMSSGSLRFRARLRGPAWSVCSPPVAGALFFLRFVTNF